MIKSHYEGHRGHYRVIVVFIFVNVISAYRH